MEAVILIGVQGAGKSTFYKNNFFNTHLRISLDLFNKSRHHENEILQTVIQARQAFVVDNTNPTQESRKKYIDQARKAKYKIKAYYFAVGFDEAMQRNLERHGKAVIPEAGLKSVLKVMQKPTFDEGFDEIYFVQTIDNDFIVKPFAP